MPDVKKPLATLELATAAVSLVKTAAVVFVMLMLEWARLKERKAQVEAAGAKNDLEVEKVKSAAASSEAKPADVVDSFLDAHGLPPGYPKDGQG